MITDFDSYFTLTIKEKLHFPLICILRKKCPYSELFWSAFSRIRTEYRETTESFSPRIPRVSLRIKPECGKIRIRKTTNTDTFHAVVVLIFA